MAVSLVARIPRLHARLSWHVSRGSRIHARTCAGRSLACSRNRRGPPASLVCEPCSRHAWTRPVRALGGVGATRCPRGLSLSLGRIGARGLKIAGRAVPIFGVPTDRREAASKSSAPLSQQRPWRGGRARIAVPRLCRAAPSVSAQAGRRSAPRSSLSRPSLVGVVTVAAASLAFTPAESDWEAR